VHVSACFSSFIKLGLLFLATPLIASDAWNAPSFTVDAAALRQAAELVKPEKHTEATVLLNEVSCSFDETGKVIQTTHLIYRIETSEGVENWAETSGRWDAWHQTRPEIKARVITTEGTVHWLEPKTLSDVPVHENEPDVYSDERKYGGPLPAVAPGAIVEEEVTVRDAVPLFTAGTVSRRGLAWMVPVNKTHVVISHPQSLPLLYQVPLLPRTSTMYRRTWC